MPDVRTYSVLPLLVGFALLFGVTAPAVHAACATMPTQQTNAGLPCHADEAGHGLRDTDKANDAACCVVLAVVYPCCRLDRAIRSAATITSETGPRASILDIAGTWLAEFPRQWALRSALPGTTAPAPSVTSMPRRQALLATFLI